MGSNASRRTGPGDGHRRAIVRFVREFADREGHPPSQREIARQIGLAISTVSYHVSILEQDGTLRRSAGQPRTIVQPAHSVGQLGADTVDVPLIGQIPAGIPMDAVELWEDTFALPRRLVGRGTLFMLEVKGDSMTGAAISAAARRRRRHLGQGRGRHPPRRPGRAGGTGSTVIRALLADAGLQAPGARRPVPGQADRRR